MRVERRAPYIFIASGDPGVVSLFLLSEEALTVKQRVIFTLKALVVLYLLFIFIVAGPLSRGGAFR